MRFEIAAGFAGGGGHAGSPGPGTSVPASGAEGGRKRLPVPALAAIAVLALAGVAALMFGGNGDAASDSAQRVGAPVPRALRHDRPSLHVPAPISLPLMRRSIRFFKPAQAHGR